MGKILNKVKVLQFLSIDICLGTVVLSAFIGEILSVQFSVIEYTALALSVFLIYNADHLLDIKKTNRKDLSIRRYFFLKYRYVITVALAIVSIILLFTLQFLPVSVVENGLFLTLLVVIYFLSIHLVSKKFYHKEVSAAIIYTLGIFVLPYSHLNAKPNVEFFLLMIQIFLLAFLNLLVFSKYDKANDLMAKQPSLATSIDNESMTVLIRALGVINFVLPLTLIIYSVQIGQSILPQLLILMMCLGTILISSFMHVFRKSDLYRTIGDTLFILPILYFLQ